jgi:autotransporter-associated beta strand protein
LLAAAPLVAGSPCAFAVAPPFSPGFTTGTIQNAAVTEASGIAASRMNVNVLWTHDDSGSAAQVYPMTPAGVALGTYTVTGAGAIDWEDIAVGPGPSAGAQYLYIGDIGDNLGVRPTVSVYRVPEPTVSDTQSAVSVSVGGASKLTFAYPNGPHDAESLFVDPLTKDIYIISKRESTKYVYRAAYPQATSGTTTMQLVTSLTNSNWVTAADISPDGDEIILRAGGETTGLLYTRPSGGSIADAFAATPVSIPLVMEGQGEAIGFDPQGWGYYTTTEGASAQISYFNRLPPPAGTVYWDTDGVAAGSRATTGAGLGGSGTWNASALRWYNGSAAVPWNSGGNNAVFWGAAGTVTLGSAQTVNSLSFKTTGYVVSGSTLTLGGPSVTVDAGVTATIGSVLAGTAGLVKNGAGTLQLATANSYSGGTTVNAGVLLAAHADALGTGGLSVANGATARAQAGLTKALSLAGVTTTGTGAFDLTDNDLVVRHAAGQGVATLVQISNQVKSGLNLPSGFWNGPGIMSSTAATDPAFNKALGAISNDLAVVTNGQFTGAFLTDFSGRSVDRNTVLVKFTWFGDADLSGSVDGTDYGLIDAGMLSAGSLKGWFNGDFDYSGTIDGTDYGLIDGAFLTQSGILGTPAGDALLAQREAQFGAYYVASLVAAVEAGDPTLVPEPGAMGVLAVGTFGLLGRRRRGRHYAAPDA